MDDTQFWGLIESAWAKVGGHTKLRNQLASGKLSPDRREDVAGELMETLEEVIPALEGVLGELTAEELGAFDRILERKLYDIDRADVHEVLDGSDDGFLYARGFVVALGAAYYDAVNADPAVAVGDVECEAMCYISWHLYEDKFEDELPLSEISRETCSNKAGWPELSP